MVLSRIIFYLLKDGCIFEVSETISAFGFWDLDIGIY